MKGSICSEAVGPADILYNVNRPPEPAEGKCDRRGGGAHSPTGGAVGAPEASAAAAVQSGSTLPGVSLGMCEWDDSLRPCPSNFLTLWL